MAQPLMSEEEITAALVRGVKAQGPNTTERARRMGYRKRRIEHFERGVFPEALIKFIVVGIVSVNEFPEPDTAGK